MSTVARIYAIIVLAFFPLWTGTIGYRNIIFDKALFFWIISLVFYVVFAMFMLTHIIGLEKEDRNFKFWQSFKWFDWALVALLIIATISCIISPYQAIVWQGYRNRNDGWFSYTIMFINYFILSRFMRPNKSDLVWFAGGSILVCIIGIFQFHGLDLFNLFPYTSPPYADELGNPFFSGYSILYRSTLGNIDFVSTYASMTVVIFGIMFIRSKGLSKLLFLAASMFNFDLLITGGAELGKVAILGAMVILIPFFLKSREELGFSFILVSSWGVAYTLHHFIFSTVMKSWVEGSVTMHDYIVKLNYRSLPLHYVLLASFVALAFGLVLVLFKQLKWPPVKTCVIAGIAIVACAVGGAFFAIEILGKHPTNDIIYQAREILHGNFSDDFGSNRLFIWRTAFEIHFNHFQLFGTGTDTFYYALGDRIQTAALMDIGTIFDKAHNDYIQILLCNGILALAAYLAFVFGVGINSLKKALNNDLVFACFGGFAAYLIQAFFGIDSIVVTPIFWLVVALLRNYQLNHKTEN